MVPLTVVGIGGYISRFFTKKGVELRIEYFQIYLGHVEESKEIKYNMRVWLQEKNTNIYENILQAKRVKEAGFISSSHISIDLEILRDSIKSQLEGIKVGLRCKSIFRGKIQYSPERTETIIKAIYIDLSLDNF